MKFVIHATDPSGKTVELQGEAMPQHERLPVPAGLQVALTAPDSVRLQKAFLRYHRAFTAGQALGNVGMTFAHGVGFTCTEPPDENVLKLFAFEARPFFLEKDPLFFSHLLNVPSLVKAEEFRPSLKRHRLRWERSAFGGVMSVSVGGKTLDTHHVVQTWFNCDMFHSEPLKPNEFSLDDLVKQMGGEQQARAILAHHLMQSVLVLQEFFTDLTIVNADFAQWVTSELAKKNC